MQLQYLPHSMFPIILFPSNLVSTLVPSAPSTFTQFLWFFVIWTNFFLIISVRFEFNFQRTTAPIPCLAGIWRHQIQRCNTSCWLSRTDKNFTDTLDSGLPKIRFLPISPPVSCLQVSELEREIISSIPGAKTLTQLP